MAGRGQIPKSPATRRRTNKVAGARVLRADIVAKAPQLPARDWHPMALAWWSDLWASPMAPELDKTDIHGLLMLADLIDLYWRLEPHDLRGKQSLASEIRLQRQAYGLSPIDRRRLQWEIERAEQALESSAKRRQSLKAGARADPRLR